MNATGVVGVGGGVIQSKNGACSVAALCREFDSVTLWLQLCLALRANLASQHRNFGVNDVSKLQVFGALERNALVGCFN